MRMLTHLLSLVLILSGCSVSNSTNLPVFSPVAIEISGSVEASSLNIGAQEAETPKTEALTAVDGVGQQKLLLPNIYRGI